MPLRLPLRLNTRALLAYGHDLVMTAVSLWLALYLRLGDELASYDLAAFVPSWLALIAAAALVYQAMGLYRGIWRYASLDDLIALTRAVTLVVGAFLVFEFVLSRLAPAPRSLPFIMWFVMMALLGGPRFIYRAVKDRGVTLTRAAHKDGGVPVLLIGAGDGAELFLRHVARAGGGYRVVGIAAEGAGRVGRRIHGVEVLGTADNLAEVLRRLKEQGRAPSRVIVTKDDLPGPKVSEILETSARFGATLARLPRLTDLREHAAGERIEVRPVAVEDLLGRPQTPLDRDAMARLAKGKRVLITGAGGSIGSELTRQVSDLDPAFIAVLDASEFNLYTADMALHDRRPDLPREAVLADVRDAAAVIRVMERLRPDLVFHAAALKHVPLSEDHPEEAVLTNVTGTLNTAQAAVRAGVASFVLISTDKAVNPTSIMGATKRAAEMICQGMDLEGGRTRFVTVRFGNVLGSTGSVVPLFQKQLAAGGPLTVTHPDMTRYFMTVREAVELVLEASALGAESDAPGSGAIHVLDMGAPVKIIDLARQMIRLAGFEPDTDIAVKITGPRPGEKIHEEVFHAGETHVPTDKPGVLLARPRAAPLADLKADLESLTAAARAADRDGVKAALRRLAPEYTPPEGAA
ncbi:MAG: polysaccharide biosynthesis protein [Rhodospirillales bacterium]